MSDIFISYASEDRAHVQPLARVLEQKGWSVWWDRRIPIGRSFDEVIEEALDASKAVVVVWTQASVKSQWVKNEAREGLRRRVLFPVMLFEEVKIPLEFRDVQAARLMDWRPNQHHPGFEQFMQDLAHVLGPPPTADAEQCTSMAGAAPLDSVSEPFKPQGTMEFSGVSQESAQASEDRLSESTGIRHSSEPFPYLPIVLGLLAAIGALVYYVVFTQGPSPGTRDVSQNHPAEQVPSARTMAITPPPTPEQKKQPPTVMIQKKPAVKREITSGGTVATKPQKAGGPVKEATLKDGGPRVLIPAPRGATSPVQVINGKDGAPMVLIPAGEFLMGSSDDVAGEPDERPRHRVVLDPFYLDQYEVTNRLFRQFVNQTGYRTTAENEGYAFRVRDTNGTYERNDRAYWGQPISVTAYPESDWEESPVVAVSVDDARIYCRWAGKRLPTEAEFEYATRAGAETEFWWGDGSPGARRVANIVGESNRENDRWSLFAGPRKVGSSDANPFGLYDMTGNVSEWTADWYDADYYAKSPERNPPGPSSGMYRVLRGGSWNDGTFRVRSAFRLRIAPAARSNDIGFRCAQDVPK